MLAAVEGGDIDAIVTWPHDRLHRSPRELEAFIDLVERTHVRPVVVTGGDSTSRHPREAYGAHRRRGASQGIRGRGRREAL